MTNNKLQERKAQLKKQGFTDAGVDAYILVDSYNLGAFYDPFAGNVIIKTSEYTGKTKEDALRFITENKNWKMGTEFDYIYITEE